jgi:hypothetical protein
MRLAKSCTTASVTESLTALAADYLKRANLASGLATTASQPQQEQQQQAKNEE